MTISDDSGGTMRLEASNPKYYAKTCKLVLYNILRDSIRGSRSIRTLGPLGVVLKVGYPFNTLKNKAQQANDGSLVY